MKYILFGLMVMVSGCSSYQLVSNDPDIWVTKKTPSGLYGAFAGETLYFCRARKHDDKQSSAEPICYEAQTVPDPEHAQKLMKKIKNDEFMSDGRGG